MGIFFSQRSITAHTFVGCRVLQIDQLAKWRNSNTKTKDVMERPNMIINKATIVMQQIEYAFNSATIKNKPINRTLTVRLRHSVNAQLTNSSQGSGDNSEKTQLYFH